MAEMPTSEIIERYPIIDGLQSIDDLFRSFFMHTTITSYTAALRSMDNLDYYYLANELLQKLQTLSAASELRSLRVRGPLSADLSKLADEVKSGDFNEKRIDAILKAIFKQKSDHVIWHRVYDAVAEMTPPPYVLSQLFADEGPWMQGRSQFASTNQYRERVGWRLTQEVEAFQVGVPRLYETFFGCVSGLEVEAAHVFAKCQEGDYPLYSNEGGWRGWPQDAEPFEVSAWLSKFVEQLRTFARPGFIPDVRRFLQLPRLYRETPRPTHTLGIGFVRPGLDGVMTHWDQLLIPGGLRSDPRTMPAARMDLARYARLAFAVQETRRFVLGLALCGSVMNLLEFDRLGGMAGSEFDINQDGLRFVSVVLACLRMNDQQVGKDPTILRSNGRRYVEVERDGRTERIFFQELLSRSSNVAGRETVCWTGYLEGSEAVSFVIKDSWQNPGRAEGVLLREAAQKDVEHIVRYYHHCTVMVDGQIDDVRSNIRRGLGSTEAGGEQQLNRIHHRLVVQGLGKPIHMARSRIAFLAALIDCIEGCESLHKKAGILHRDISANNLLMYKDGSGDYRGFLIDLDIAIKVHEEAWGVGTRPFMAIGGLMNQPHTFMHDIESFFWVLVWISVCYDGQQKGARRAEVEKWDDYSVDLLAEIKYELISNRSRFLSWAFDNVAPYYRPLLPWIERLRAMIFPDGLLSRNRDLSMYADIVEVLRDAMNHSDMRVYDWVDNSNMQGV
ncbi:hypothetical protein BDY21DRAFT_145487 [Lineolata rhizophorae]|uniref:non-specific serine/threonine protein kinase n=1 Tax=Lineolata rhizophorae TaxID=578093 RepID=A0A6A6NP03_9PEZI|nr:hypothetical protein BDY21DRAFT_145487 [Lineolata rhizophorae]